MSSTGLAHSVVAMMAFLSMVIILSMVGPVIGAGSTTPPPDPVKDRGDTMEAYVQMQVIEISKIDGVEQAFHADFYMLTSWYAPVNDTLIDPADPASGPFTGTEDLSPEILDAQFWSPRLEFVNAREDVTRLVSNPFGFGPNGGLEPPFPIQTIRPGFVLPPGYRWITEDQRYQCDFTTPLSMEDFPFDQQYMQLLIESYWDTTQVKIVWAIPDAINGLISKNQQIVGWSFIESVQIPAIDAGILYEYNQRRYDRLTIRTLLKRQPDFYMTKIVVGSLLLVYMCVCVFALAVDEADRMMGTLQIFAGLVTFLFVASGDTPKVPYQTRLDLFMLWSFFNVALMLIIHASLYYWRECDIEEMLEEREKESLEAKKKKMRGSRSGEFLPEVEMGGVSPASPSARVYVNEPTPKVMDVESAEPSHSMDDTSHPTKWRLRQDSWKTFTLRKWFNGLHFTRKSDAIAMPTLAIIYSIGTAVIFGRPILDVKINYAAWNDVSV